MSAGPPVKPPFTTTFDTHRIAPQSDATGKDFWVYKHGPIIDGLMRGAKAMRERNIEPAEIHMSRATHDALLAEIGLPDGFGVILTAIHDMRIVIK